MMMIHLRLQITPISYVVSRHRSLSLTKSKKLYEEYYSDRDGCSASPSTEMATVIRMPVTVVILSGPTTTIPAH
ncbi:unnamed protein product [Arabidopsis halleri]